MSSHLKPAVDLVSSDSSARTPSRPAPAATSADAKAAREARARRRNTARDSARTKARYDSLVLRWQEKLLDPAVSELLLRQAAQYLTPDDFDNTILERTSGDLCGYPLCANPTRKLEKRYHISVRQRKLFDMGEHASYCSNRCMVGSRFYKQQLSEEPVYMRNRKENLDIEVLPLSIEGAQDQISLTGPNGASTTEAVRASDQSLINWYRDSLMAKMNIPKRVADANPLQIVEHTSVKVADDDLSAAVGKLQFADIEGFEPEADTSRIKKAISFTTKFAKARGYKSTASRGSTVPAKVPVKKGSEQLRRVADTDIESSPSGPPTPLDTTPCDTDAKDKDSDNSETEEGNSDDDDDDDEEDEDEEDDDDSNDDGGVVDSGCFVKQLDIESTHTGAKPALSLFGRMWMLADRMATEKTQMYLRDLRQASDAGMSNLNMAEYYIAPGDQAMAIRHRLLVDAVARELDMVRDKLQLQVALRHELRTFVSTLELGSNMAMFNKSETRLLCITFTLALAKSMYPQHPLNDPKSTLLGLDDVLGGLGTDRGSLSMISRRFHEPY
ncbi:hypothetical protein GGH94_002264 [Coemansia aciculifera]|uniref:RNA polymerase II subunit B1 CTD phosphatase RPAP2 homolog n=1 Tax=Coemansia aciculifera TaxID=417176 RepID=A0A9W8ILG3_9FUNG|nr:hypothetical protein GGH94_002264 [Coemansia aciculifera]